MEKTKMSITEIDINFKLSTATQEDKENMDFYSVADGHFDLYGVFKENGKFRRMPEKVAESVSERTYYLHTNTAGGRIRFTTDSSFIYLIAKTDNVCRISHMPILGAAGFDVYVETEDGERYKGPLQPPFDVWEGFEAKCVLGEKKERQITINFPLYTDVIDVFIGLEKGSILKEGKKYKNEKPVVYYGSSITQGGCASRPGNSYEAVISRRQNLHYINLGFSGSAKAEDEMIDYVKNLDMSVFVYDYDHNAPDAEHLKKTHKKMFDAVRENNPDLPIIILTRPDCHDLEAIADRRAVIYDTYKQAIDSGDKNVYFIGGEEIYYMLDPEMMTTDAVHPGDFGFYCMAEKIGKVIEEILSK